MGENFKQASTGIPSYDAARWRDWLPRFDRVYAQGPLGTLRQRAPANSIPPNETDVPAHLDHHVLLIFTKPAPELEARFCGQPVTRGSRRDR